MLRNLIINTDLFSEIALTLKYSLWRSYSITVSIHILFHASALFVFYILLLDASIS